MDLDRLASFVWVIETSSFTQAANRLGLPKSTVSRRVAALEDELGIRLIQRSTRKLAPTEAGEALYQRSAPALRTLESALRDAELFGDRPRGMIRISAPLDFGTSQLPALIREFLDRYPEAELSLEFHDRYVDLIGEGFDLALRFGNLEDSSLIARRLVAIEIGFFATRQYLAQYGTPKTLEDLEAHQIILFRGSRGLAPVELETPDGETSLELRGRLSVTSFGFMRKMIQASAGIGLLPRFLITDADITSGLIRVLPDVKINGGDFQVVYPSSRNLSANTRAFLDYMIEKFGAMSPRF